MKSKKGISDRFAFRVANQLFQGEITSFRGIGGTLNRFWQGEVNEDSFVLRCSHEQRSEQSLRLELELLDLLSLKGEHVPRPFFINGSFMYMKKVNHLWTAFHYIKTIPIKRFSPSDLFSTGRLLRQIHETSSMLPHKYARPNKWMIHELSKQWHFNRLNSTKEVKQIGDKLLLPTLRFLEHQLQRKKDSVICHNDVHPANMFRVNHSIGLLDFDDCIWSTALLDIITAAVSICLLGIPKMSIEYIYQAILNGYKRTIAVQKKYILYLLFLRYTFFYSDTPYELRQILSFRFLTIISELKKL